MKMNSLVQQVRAQKELQVTTEQIITKAVKQALPDIVRKQVEDTVAPMLARQMEILDTQVNQSLIPKIESSMAKIAKVAQANQQIANNSQSGTGNISSQTKQPQISVPPELVKKIVQGEFRSAMEVQVMPELERQLKTMLDKVKEPINSANKVLFEKLVNEEQRSDELFAIFESKMQTALEN